MKIHDEFSGTITLTENSSRELLKVLNEQDEAFINDMLDGRWGFTLKSADGRSVELVPKADRPQGEWIKHDEDRDYCSVCKHIFKTRTLTKQDKWTTYVDDLGYNFCPNCGAKMKGASDDSRRSQKRAYGNL